jgi:predicted double-glycine peptidase
VAAVAIDAQRTRRKRPPALIELRALRLAAAGAAALALAGCSAVAPFRGLTLTEEALHIRGVPPLQQDKQYACGAVCVAAVAAYWGVELTEFKRRQPAMPDTTTGRELQRLAQTLGLRAFVYRGDLGDLRDNLKKGRPVIVMLSKPPDPAWRRAGLAGALAQSWSERLKRPPHWVVVVGLADDGSVIVHDPASGALTIKGASFEKWWKQMDQLCVLVARS